jgi:protein-S-isoprenylcysteine O-methyltransferase Ste14
MVTLGNFFFKFRNLLFPLVLLFVVLVCSPAYVLGDPQLDVLFDGLGALVAGIGLGVRALTIGYDYIVRGGRHGQVHADRLVAGGVFAHTRNPLYLGNTLIVLGFALIIHAKEFYLICLPLVALAYAAIIAAEEQYLRGKFGAEFNAYCRRVNRILPHFSGFRHSIEGMEFNWRRLLVKEYNTIFTVVACIFGLSVLDDYRLRGGEALPAMDTVLLVIVPLAVLYLVVWGLKKTRRLVADPGEPHRAT